MSVDRTVEDAVFGLLGGDSGVGVGGHARQFAVTMLSAGLGAMGVILSIIVPAIANFFPHLRTQLPPRITSEPHSTRTHTSTQRRTHHHPPVSRRTHESHSHATSTSANGACSAESLSTIISSSATSATPCTSPPSSTQTSPRTHTKHIPQLDNAHASVASSGNLATSAICAYSGNPTTSDIPAPGRRQGAAVQSRSNPPLNATAVAGNGLVASFRSSVVAGCSKAQRCSRPGSTRSQTLPSQSDIERASMAAVSSSGLDVSTPDPSVFSPTPRTSNDTGGQQFVPSVHRVETEREGDLHQRQQLQAQTSPPSSTSASGSVPAMSSAKPRPHSFFSLSYLRRSSLTPSKLSHSSSGSSAVPCSPSSQSLPSALRRGSINSIGSSQRRHQLKHQEDVPATNLKREKPDPANQIVGAVGVRRTRSSPCKFAAKLRGKGKGKARAGTSDSVVGLSDVEKEKENTSDIASTSSRKPPSKFPSKSSKPKSRSSSICSRHKSSTKRPPPLPLQPPARTRPYEMPFHFPSPLASELEKEMYVRAAREELRRERGRVDSGSTSTVSVEGRMRSGSGKASRGASLTRPVSDVDEFGVIASAPAQALSFANAKSLRRNSHATSTAPVNAKDRQTRPRPMSLNSSTPSDRGVLGPEDRVKIFVAEPEPVNPLSGVVEAGVDLPILEPMVAGTSPMTGKSDENQQAPSSVGIDESPAPRRGGWSLLKRHRKVW